MFDNDLVCWQNHEVKMKVLKVFNTFSLLTMGSYRNGVIGCPKEGKSHEENQLRCNLGVSIY